MGRLCYLASLRNANTGRYEHYGLSQLYGGERAHRTLSESHQATFTEWLDYELVRQQEDLRQYLESLDAELGSVVNAWLQLETYKTLLPLTASEAQRDLFVTDIEALLRAIKASVAASSPAPIAWPQR